MKKEVIESKKLAFYVFNFVKLNPWKNKYPRISKYDINAFYVIQKVFKSASNNFSYSNYDQIFYNKNKTSMSGEEWVNILINSNNLLDYHTKVRSKFFFCRQKLLKEKISFEVFSWYYNSRGKEIIENIETDFNNDIKISLNKIRNLLINKDWSDFFFNLQKLMHLQIISFLSWDSESLNYNSYSKVMKKKLKQKLDNDEVNRILEIVQKINLYRNSLSKINSGSGSESLELFEKWNKFSNDEKLVICLNLYFSLVEFISVINIVFNNDIFL